MIEVRAKEQAKEVAVEAAPAWTDVEAVPQSVINHANLLALTPPTVLQWNALQPSDARGA